MNYIVKKIEHLGDLDHTVFLGKNKSLSYRPLKVEPFTYEKNAQKFIDRMTETDEFIKAKYPDISRDSTYEIIAVPTHEELVNAKCILAMREVLENTFA